MNGSQVRIVDSSFDHNCAGSGNGHIVAIHGSQLDIKNAHTGIIKSSVSRCLCGIIRSYMSNITINIQENFTERANPEYTLYDIEGAKSCDRENINNANGGDDDLLPLWSLIQSETSSQIALTVSLTLLTTILLLVLGIVITSIILYR